MGPIPKIDIASNLVRIDTSRPRLQGLLPGWLHDPGIQSQWYSCPSELLFILSITILKRKIVSALPNMFCDKVKDKAPIDAFIRKREIPP